MESFILQQLEQDAKDKESLAAYIAIIDGAQAEKRYRYPKKDVRYKYFEQHHILPKSLYAEFDKTKSNLVYLTASEHYTVHKLLCKIFPGQAMAHAFWRMSCCNSAKTIISAEDFAFARELNAQYPATLGYHPTETTRELLSKASKQYWANGGYKHTEQQHKKAVETRHARGLYVQTAEQKQKTSQKIKGRIFINNGIINKFIWPADLDTFLQQGWKRGKKPLSAEHKANIGKAGKERYKKIHEQKDK